MTAVKMSSESNHAGHHHNSVSASSDVPRKPLSKSAEHRRATKPIMEKRRRARINACLNELKSLILEATNRDPSRHTKLEKADILEMTVRYLQSIQRQKVASAIATDPSVMNKFRAGFAECAKEVTNFLEVAKREPSPHVTIDKVDVLERTVRHLENYQRQQLATSMVPHFTVMYKFPADFSPETAQDLTNFFQRNNGSSIWRPW